jgi:hypothetical protein
MTAVAQQEPVSLIRLDLGCGKNKKPDFIGVDIRAFDGVDVVTDLSGERWPWDDESVIEVNCSHFVEHLTARQRIHFCNELHRVLVPGKYDMGGKPSEGFATIITPHWNSGRAFGDLTHQWPPVCEMWFSYLNKDWREANAPHNDEYSCHFEITWYYTIRPDLAVRNSEFQVFALSNYKEAAQDLISTWIKR